MNVQTLPEQRRGTYKGQAHNLKGKRALLQIYPTGRCLAQFDDVLTGYGHGWHDFPTEEFDLDPVVDWDAPE